MESAYLFLIFMFGGFSLGVVAARMGCMWVQGLMIVLTLYVGLCEGKVISVFGFPTTLGTALYGVIFFLANVLTELYGRKQAWKAIRMGIAAAITFQILLQSTRLAVPIPEAMEMSAAMDVVFGFSLRVTVASLFVYAISQSLEVFIYQRMREWTDGRHLWLRNNISTIIAQAVDTWAFVFLAFYGVVEEWYWMALTGYGLKIIISLSDTGFIYLARAIRPSSTFTDLPPLENRE